MKQPKNLRERYIQLVETFITALENGESGSELENIRNDIRTVSTQLGLDHPVENHTQLDDLIPLKAQKNEDAAK